MKKALLAVVLAGLLGLAWFALTPRAAKEITVSLPTENGDFDLLWRCTAPNGEADARLRAAQAHAAFQTGLQVIATDTAAAMQAAMAQATASGTVPETLPELDDAAEAASRALADRVGAEVGCQLDEF